MANTVSGNPSSYSKRITRVPTMICCNKAKEIAIRNTGCNTLWVSMDGIVWFDVACGTSWDARLEADHFFARTKVGETDMVCLCTT